MVSYVRKAREGAQGISQALDREDWPAPGRQEWLALLAILVLAAALRLYRIDAIPPGLWFDEAAYGVDAQHVLQGERPIFFEGNQGREPLYIYLVALSFWLLGPGPTSIRIVSVALGLATVLATHFLAREMLGRRVALLASFVAATAFWPVSLSRLGLRAVALPLLAALAAFFLWHGVRRRRLWCYALAGLAGGLSLYTYLAGRAVPVWLGAFGLALAFPAWRPGLTLRRHALGLALLAAVAALTIAPLARYYVGHPTQFLGRVTAASLAVRAETVDVPTDTLPVSVLKTVGMFVYRGDVNPRYNVPGRPFFDVFLAAAFLVGVGLALRRVARPEYALLLLWTSVMLAPGALATEAPHFLRTVGVLPAIFVFPALGVDAAWRRAATLPWPAVRRLVPTFLALGLVISAAVTARDYFDLWAERPDVYYAFLGDIVDAGPLATQLADQGTVLVSVWSYRGIPMPLALYPSPDRVARTFPGLSSLVFPGSPSGDLYYVYPRNASPDDAGLCSLVPCREPFQVLRDPSGGEAVRVFRVPGGTPSHLRPSQPLVARLGDYLEIRGYDLHRRFEPGQRLRLTLYTRILRPLTESGDWKLFAHLVEPGGSQNRASGYADATHVNWQPGDTLVVWLDLPTRRSLPPGLYEVHFGIFENSSLRRQRVFDAADRDVGSLLILGPVRALGPAEQPPEAPGRLDFRLGEKIRLVGYDLDPAPRAGDFLHLSLYWQAADSVDDDYTVFVHLMDGENRLVGQQDTQPRGGRLPTGVWSPGEVVLDEYRVPISPSLRGQRLNVLVGLYKLETGKRLPARDADGKPLGDAIHLAEVEPR